MVIRGFLSTSYAITIDIIVGEMRHTVIWIVNDIFFTPWNKNKIPQRHLNDRQTRQGNEQKQTYRK